MSVSRRIKNFLFVQIRVWKYKLLSTCSKVSGKPIIFHPLLLNGKGTISFGNNVQIGVINSANFYTHYTYLEARTNGSKIIIGNNTAINNAFSAVAFLEICIGNDVLIGSNCTFTDNDGHHLAIEKRTQNEPKSKAIIIENNVFIGNNVTVLKGVTIGENSVIGSGSIVTKSIPENVIAAGNPARIIRSLEHI